MPAIPEAFKKVGAFLEREKVPFVLIGGIAAGLQGEPRTTLDIDLMVTLPSSKVSALARAAVAEGFEVEPDLAETQWLATGFFRMWFGPEGKGIPIDFMACNSDYLRQVTWRAQHVRFCGLPILVATAEDLILFKLSAWREKDIPDIRAILLRQRERLDTGYLRKWAEWFKMKNPVFKEMPDRLEGVLANRPLPPGTP